MMPLLIRLKALAISQIEMSSWCWHSICRLHEIQYFVIPAKAGIHHPPFKLTPKVMDPRLRGGDESDFPLLILNDNTT